MRLASGAGFDVLILGGGVNGVAVFRELALNGVSALLVERSDFCRGASGASSRMAHGGLRYLENREFKLVAESARERNLLLRHAAHFTQPLEVVVPLTSYLQGLPGSILRFLGVGVKGSTLSAAGLKAALTLYEHLGRVGRVLPSHRTNLRRVDFPRYLARRYKAVISYFDARIRNPEALVLEMLEEAMAVCPVCAALNHVSWNHQSGSNTFSIRDGETGQTFAMRPKLVVNASGAWVDEVNALLGRNTSYVRPVKGAHLVLRHDALFERMAGRAFYFDDGTGRMVISYPLDRTILLGTTEIPTPDPSDDTIAGDEITYLTSAISSLFEDIEVRREHIVAMTTGMRPLQSGGAGDANRANRDHRIAEDRLAGDVPLLSLIGGKWTTFRAFGEQVADRILAHLQRTRSVGTRERDYPGATGFGAGKANAGALVKQLEACFALTSTRAEELVHRYGAVAEQVAAFCAETTDAPLEHLAEFTRNEIRWLIEERAALGLDDLILRRTQIALDGDCSEPLLRELAFLLAQVRGKPASWADCEIERCLAMPSLLCGAGRPASLKERRRG